MHPEGIHPGPRQGHKIQSKLSGPGKDCFKGLTACGRGNATKLALLKSQNLVVVDAGAVAVE